jgi:hypothetical protein
MTTITFNTLPGVQSFISNLSAALDAFATYRIQPAVPEFKLRQAECEINRYHRRTRGRTARQLDTMSAAASSRHFAQWMRAR